MENKTKFIWDQINDSSLYELLRRKEKFSWYIENDYQKYIKNTIDELLELQEWIENNNIDNIQEETMDVIMMVWQLINKLVSDDLIKELDFKKHKDKIIWRSPNLKPWNYIWLEEEHRLWQELKLKQK